jgi:hypothetical protein
LFSAVGLLCSSVTVRSSDHADTPMLAGAGRHDVRITDLHAFVRDGNLVLTVCMNPTVPATVSEYVFPSDMLIKINIDNNSPVSFGNPSDVATFGGTIDQPGNIQEDIVFEIGFDAQGDPVLNSTGLSPAAQQNISLFSGLRDDPFIRGPVIGRNVGAVALMLPLSDVLDGQSTLLIWATTWVDDFAGAIHEHAGRSLRSQLGPNLAMNTLHPRDHFLVLGVIPDVLLYNTALPAAAPNGRELADDVVNIFPVPPVLNSDFPFPTENDRPFMNSFPFLAAPHATPGIPTVSQWGILVMVLLLLAGAKVRFDRRRLTTT